MFSKVRFANAVDQDELIMKKSLILKSAFLINLKILKKGYSTIFCQNPNNCFVDFWF